MIMEWLKKLNNKDTTVVEVTHNEKWAEYGDRVVELGDGVVQEDGAVR